MAKTKKCSSCNELKLTTQFSKYKRTKDGLQAHCKHCQSIRTRPLTEALLKADKNGCIYKITNPEGETYIGKTFKKVKYRFAIHKSIFNYNNKFNKVSTLPILHNSFKKWGIDAHTFELVAEYKNISKEDLRNIETKLIQSYKKNNKSLNKNN